VVVNVSPAGGGANGLVSITYTPPPFATSTAVSCSPDPVAIDAPATCTATVTDEAGTTSTPTGTVSFTSNGAGSFDATQCTLSGSGASAHCSVTYTPSAFGTQAHTLTAGYFADAKHVASFGSEAVSVGVRSADTSVGCSPNPVAVGGSTTCTATVTDTSAGTASTPTGTVGFNANGAGSFAPDTPCTLSQTGPGVASCSVTYTPIAGGTIMAQFGGDDKHAGNLFSFGTTFVSVIVPRSTSTSVSCSPDPVAVDAPTTCTATVTDTDAGTASTPTGTVKFGSNRAGSFSDDQCGLNGTSASAGCSVTYTPGAKGSPTITAGYHSGDATHVASGGSQTVTVIGVAPAAPTITSLANGNGQVGVGFTDGNPGTSPITSHEVTATDLSDPAAPPEIAKGPNSPIAVKGLTNGDTYVFTVTATSADGTSPPSAQSGRLNVGTPVIQRGPGDGVVGRPYSSGFVVTGAPSATVTQVSGELPPGLTLSGDGALTGTPTTAGSYPFRVRADNGVGIDFASVTVTIFPGAACAGRAALIVGTAGANRLAGTLGSDVMAGGAGSDRIRAGGGGDLVCAGRGNDRVLGGAGNDRVLGEAGNDILFGDGGRDLLRGGTGNDRLSGDAGNDRLAGDSGNDRVSGGLGNDRVNPGAGRDRVAAGPGDDGIFSLDSRRDVIDCGRGHDVAIVDAVDRTRRCETVIRVQAPAPPDGLG
jgi:hypothetical protein